MYQLTPQGYFINRAQELGLTASDALELWEYLNKTCKEISLNEINQDAYENPNLFPCLVFTPNGGQVFTAIAKLNQELPKVLH